MLNNGITEVDEVVGFILQTFLEILKPKEMPSS